MIKQRVLEVIDFKGVKKESFFKKIGITSANFRGKAAETPLNSTAIENIFTVFPDLNIEWLITGKGEMLKTETSINIENYLESSIRNHERQLDQLYRIVDILASKLDINKESLYNLSKK